MKLEGSGSISQRHGSPDPDPHQNVTDPQQCFIVCLFAAMRAAAKAVPAALLAAAKYSGTVTLAYVFIIPCLGLFKAALWMRTGFNANPVKHFWSVRIRIQGCDGQKLYKVSAEINKNKNFDQKCNLLIPI